MQYNASNLMYVFLFFVSEGVISRPRIWDPESSITRVTSLQNTGWVPKESMEIDHDINVNEGL